MKEPCCSMHRGVDLWTVISMSAEIAKIWLRSGNEPNSDAYEMLLPGLDDLEPDDAQEATDIVNTLFPPDEALQFIRVLLRHPDKGSDLRIVSVNQPGIAAYDRACRSCSLFLSLFSSMMITEVSSGSKATKSTESQVAS